VSADRPAVGVGVVIIDQGRLLVVQRGGAVRRGLWAVPGGRQRFGERMADTAVREAKEETGLDVRLGDVVWVGDAIGEGDPPDHHFVLIDFAAEVVGGELRAGDDALAAEFVPLAGIRDRQLAPSMYDLLDHLGV